MHNTCRRLVVRCHAIPPRQPLLHKTTLEIIIGNNNNIMTHVPIYVGILYYASNININFRFGMCQYSTLHLYTLRTTCHCKI